MMRIWTYDDLVRTFACRVNDERLGQQPIAPAVREQLDADLVKSAETRINAMILETLPSHALVKLDQFCEAGTDLDVQLFLVKHIPDLEQRVWGVLQRLRNELLGVAS